ncbi:MAG: hypothetical protein LBJ01_06680 [Tannerella sp.]|jgi:hypothetical protein|nr:hypothetical protein [Tannerella sp.]
MSRDVFPLTIEGFTTYIKTAYAKAQANLQLYMISPEKLVPVTPLYTDYIAKEALAANPETATQGNRLARDAAGDLLKTAWRHFLNESIRYNTSVPTADLLVFGIRPPDGIRTPAQVPEETGIVDVKRRGAFDYEATVLDEKTLKRKLPPHATGSYLYLFISKGGVLPERLDEYRKLDFSSNARHSVQFSPADVGKLASLYARYSNRHGKEGPAGPVISFLIN